MTLEIIFVAAVIVVLVVAFVVLTRRGNAGPVAQQPPDGGLEDGVVSDPVPVDAMRPRTNIAKREIGDASVAGSVAPSWAAQFEPRHGALDAGARRKLIDDLGMLRAPWCVPLLERAVVEETDSAIRSAAASALTQCRAAAGTTGD